MKKRWIAAGMVLVLMLSMLLAGCRRAEREDETVRVVCTVFPAYDWVRELVGDREGVKVTLLSKSGTDLHSYQPTAADMIEIRECDLLIRLGGSADGWLTDALKGEHAEGRIDLAMSEVAGVTLCEVSAGSADGHDHEHGHGRDNAHVHHEQGESDEHLWLSLRNASACVRAISDALSSLDGAGATDYAARRDAYQAKLSGLDADFQALTEEAVTPRMVVVDRFPFVYLARDYGIEYLAAFEGCGTETGADAETVVRLAKQADEWQVKAWIVTEKSDGTLAESVDRASTAGARPLLVLDSMQSVTERELEEGKTYLGTMEQNLSTLRQALLP